MFSVSLSPTVVLLASAAVLAVLACQPARQSPTAWEWRVRLYEHTSWSGRVHTITGDNIPERISLLKCYNDKASSMKWDNTISMRRGRGICICLHDNETGFGATRCLKHGDSIRQFHDVGINDRTSAFTVYLKDDINCVSVLHYPQARAEEAREGC